MEAQPPHDIFEQREFADAPLNRSRDFYVDVVGLQWLATNADGSLSFRCGSDDCTVVLH